MAISGANVALAAAVLEAYALVTTRYIHLPVSPWLAALTLTLSFNFFLFLVGRTIIHPNLISPLRHLPGPKGNVPVFGLLKAVFETPPGESFYKWMTTIPNNGLLRFQGLLNDDVLLVTTPAGVAEILVNKPYNFEKPENAREQLRTVLGDGLVVVEGDIHKFQRKRITPSFGFRHIKDLYPVMWSKGLILTERINAEFQASDTITIDIIEWASKATLDAIGVAALGRDFNSIYNDDDELSNIYRMLSKPSKGRQIWFALCILFSPKLMHKLPIPINVYFRGVVQKLHQVCRDLVNEKRAAIEKRGDDHYDILSVLIKSNDFSDDELVDQMLTFLAAGSDTTSLTFTWTCHLLSKYPQVQTKLRQEILAVYPDLLAASQKHDDSLATLLESLPYLNGVFHETLRLFPTVPMTQRVANTDTELLGQPIPKGTEFTLSMCAMNRMPDFWGPDAAEFKPERWIDKETGKPNNHGGAVSNYCMLTFLAGPRSCIGQNFARAELRCLLASWVASFEMEDANVTEPTPVGAITMKPMGGMNLRLRQVGKAKV